MRLSRDAARTHLGILRDSGMEITELTPDQARAFRAATDSVYAEWSGKINPIIRKLWEKHGLTR